MTPGNFPLQLKGYKILESQILHIIEDAKSNKLNSFIYNGGTEVWGTYKTDTPIFRFTIAAAVKDPIKGTYTFMQSLQKAQ